MTNARERIQRYVAGIANDGDERDSHLGEMLDQVEDDRAHREAERLRNHAGESTFKLLRGIMDAASLIDPYIEVDGQLYLKSDGKPVTT